MQKYPRISIITPSYNQAGFIGQTIESVLSQGYPDLEYIVMDGGSTDGTLEILRQYEGRLRWFSEPDRGQSHAINKGLALATGQVFAYLNSDDLYEPGALWRVGEFFAAHPDAAWLSGRCRIIDEQGQEIQKAIQWYKNFWLRFKSYRVLLVLDYIAQPATFWGAQVLKQVGYFDEAQHLVMDYDYSLRIGRCFPLVALNEILASYRVHQNSKSSLYPGPHFDADLQIARRYTTSRTLLRLHALHNALIVGTYQGMRVLDRKSSFSSS